MNLYGVLNLVFLSKRSLSSLFQPRNLVIQRIQPLKYLNRKGLPLFTGPHR